MFLRCFNTSFAVFVAGCASIQHAAPTPNPGGPIVGNPVAADVVVPPKPEPPTVGETACIDYGEAERFGRELDAYVEALEQREAAARGWRQLTEFLVMQYEEPFEGPTRFFPTGDVQIARQKSDRIVDQHGNTWLAVEGSSGCRVFTQRFYIDQKGNVFSIESAPPCTETVETAVCGSWPLDGCGVQPEYYERRFVKVPKDARLVEEPGRVHLDPMICHGFEPQDGYDYPP